MTDKEKIESAIRFIKGTKNIFNNLANQGVENMNGVLELCDKEGFSQTATLKYVETYR